jgi:atypical dual specificity phosphatase
LDTWWIDEPYLLGTRNPTTEEIEQLRREGFSVIVSLLCEDEQAPRYDIKRAVALGCTKHNIPVTDFSAPTVDELDQFITLLGGLPPKKKIVAHCDGGTGRTGTFAAVYWVMKGQTAADAIAHVRKSRPYALETTDQVRVVEEFARKQAERLQWLADYLTLVYHEARNVRHLIKANAIEQEPWKMLVALPVNRDMAWKQIQKSRATTREARTVTEILRVFEGRFKVSLDQLVLLYSNPAWRSGSFGGNAWKVIAQHVRDLASSLGFGQLTEADRLLEGLRSLRHNTGLLIEKLLRLDETLYPERKDLGKVESHGTAMEWKNEK